MSYPKKCKQKDTNVSQYNFLHFDTTLQDQNHYFDMDDSNTNFQDGDVVEAREYGALIWYRATIRDHRVTNGQVLYLIRWDWQPYADVWVSPARLRQPNVLERSSR